MKQSVVYSAPGCKVTQYDSGCLAHYGYIIDCDGELAIIDPLRDVKEYLDYIQKSAGKPKYIIESHYHADFVSGYIDLAKKTGATVVFGPESKPSFNCKVAADQEVLHLGRFQIRCLHTPGHTLESSCFVLELQGKPLAVFTGDTLFLGDVGRPDLAQKGELTDKMLAKFLFNSLKKLKALPDTTLVLPSHGAGSACGKNISKGNFCDIGTQKVKNLAFKETNEQAFIEMATTGLAAPPGYFADNVRLNKDPNIKPLDQILQDVRVLTAGEVDVLSKARDVVILDCRPAKEFSAEHIPGSVHVPFDGKLAIWATYVVSQGERIVLVAPEGREMEAAIRLTRTGLDSLLGYLGGGISAWKAEAKPLSNVDMLSYSSGEEFSSKTNHGVVVDIRDPGELEGGVYERALIKNFSQLNSALKTPVDQEIFIHCQSGVRSLIGYSLLKRKGYKVRNVDGGWNRMASLGVKAKSWGGKASCNLI